MFNSAAIRLFSDKFVEVTMTWCETLSFFSQTRSLIMLIAMKVKEFYKESNRQSQCETNFQRTIQLILNSVQLRVFYIFKMLIIKSCYFIMSCYVLFFCYSCIIYLRTDVYYLLIIWVHVFRVEYEWCTSWPGPGT